MADKKLLEDREATENLGYLIKISVGSFMLLSCFVYLIFIIKPTYQQIKEVMIYLIIYLIGRAELNRKKGALHET